MSPLIDILGPCPCNLSLPLNRFLVTVVAPLPLPVVVVAPLPHPVAVVAVVAPLPHPVVMNVSILKLPLHQRGKRQNRIPLISQTSPGIRKKSFMTYNNTHTLPHQLTGNSLPGITTFQAEMQVRS